MNYLDLVIILASIGLVVKNVEIEADSLNQILYSHCSNIYFNTT